MKKIILLLAVALTLPACATITRGKTEAYTVGTTPPGAQVSFSNGLTCPSTPCTLKMDRKPGFVVTIEKEGYETVQANVVSSVASGGGAAMAGNVLVGGLIGAAVDASSGAMNNLTPNPLTIQLTPVSANAPVEEVVEEAEDAVEEVAEEMDDLAG